MTFSSKHQTFGYFQVFIVPFVWSFFPPNFSIPWSVHVPAWKKHDLVFAITIGFAFWSTRKRLLQWLCFFLLRHAGVAYRTKVFGRFTQHALFHLPQKLVDNLSLLSVVVFIYIFCPLTSQKLFCLCFCSRPATSSAPSESLFIPKQHCAERRISTLYFATG